MKRFIVDASVAIKWYVPEIHSEAAARLLDPEIHLSAPDLIYPEFGNILWKKMRRGQILGEEAVEAVAAFRKVGIDSYPSDVLLPSAFELAAALDRTVYDCMYLAVAIARDCPLVTADQKFHDALLKTSLAGQIHWIEHPL